MIEFRNVSASYDTQTPVLRDVSFKVEDWRVRCVHGNERCR